MSTASKAQNRWLLVFILGYMALLADGAGVMMDGLTLTRIKNEFGLTNVESGALGSLTLVGMTIGGILRGWASDRLGRVRVVAWAWRSFRWARGCWGSPITSCNPLLCGLSVRSAGHHLLAYTGEHCF
ncbi:hypothetical protein [Paraburkholderia fynbosensis]|uniref:hypothetical protein n=1 Tax=Paraburkholderia fynbosensis TaxID=1200993 RepID=UPI001FEC567B|nr:hypothetical protein [Paraburkholderia fynbosensis]